MSLYVGFPDTVMNTFYLQIFVSLKLKADFDYHATRSNIHSIFLVTLKFKMQWIFVLEINAHGDWGNTNKNNRRGKGGGVGGVVIDREELAAIM